MNTEIKTGYPTVFGGDVVIANPATKEKGDAIEAEAAKLPNKEKDAFYSKTLAKMWGEMEIVAVADDCVRFIAGDKAMGTLESAKSATVTPDGMYLIINERAFKGKW